MSTFVNTFILQVPDSRCLIDRSMQPTIATLNTAAPAGAAVTTAALTMAVPTTVAPIMAAPAMTAYDWTDCAAPTTPTTMAASTTRDEPKTIKSQ